MERLALTCLVLCAVSGCTIHRTSSDAGRPSDAGTLPDPTADSGAPLGRDGAPPSGYDAGLGPPPPLPVTPDAPEAPFVGPVPSGWYPAQRDEIDVFEPWPEGGHADCAAGEIHLPGTAGCAPLGAACEGDAFPSELPDDATVVHVRPGASGGDGSAAAPLGTLAAALAAAPEGAFVALAPGTYPAGLELTRPVTIVGACAAGVVLTGDASAPVLSIAADTSVELRALTLRASGERAAWIAGTLTLRNVQVEQAQRAALHVASGGELDASRLRVRDTREGMVDGLPGALGAAVQVEAGARAELRSASVEGSRGVALGTSGELVVEDTAVLDTHCVSTFPGGSGLWAQEAGQVTARRVVVETACTSGMAALDAARIDAELAVVRDTVPSAQGGVGVMAREGGSIEIRHALVERTVGAGLALEIRTESRLTARDVVVRAVRATPELPAARCVSLFDGTAILQRVDVRDCDEAGIYTDQFAQLSASDVLVSRVPALRPGVSGGIVVRSPVQLDRVTVRDVTRIGVVVLGGNLQARELSVLDTHAVPAGDPEAGRFGQGIAVGDRGQLEGADVLVDGFEEIGIAVSDPGAYVDLRGVQIRRGAASGAPGALGIGAGAQCGATLALDQAIVEEVRHAGISVLNIASEGRPPCAETTSARLGSLRIRDVRGTIPEGWLGRGLIAEGEGVSVDALWVEVERAREVGVEVALGAELRAEHLYVRDTLPRDCAATTCASATGGHGVGVYRGSLVATDLQVERAELCGFHYVEPRAVSVTHGVARDSGFGLCVVGIPVASAATGLSFEGIDPANRVLSDDDADFYVPESPGGF